MARIITFGEIMLRLEPEGYNRLMQADRLLATYGGGEANVAVSLAGYGHSAAFVTKLPQNELGQAALNSLRRYGVDTDLVKRGGERLGVYYIEKGVSQRPSKVIYDRARSAIAQAALEDFSWDEIFAGANWFHFTGITPALGGALPDICMAACKVAKSKGIRISCDLNYRGKLWNNEQAGTTMRALAPYVDLCIANEDDAKDVFGIAALDTDTGKGEVDFSRYEEVAKRLHNELHYAQVAITLRKSISASDNAWSAVFYDGAAFEHSREYNIHVVDRVGSGDSFGAGLIHGLITGMRSADALEFAVAASCLKHSIEGDFNLVSAEEVNRLVSGNASGRVQR